MKSLKIILGIIALLSVIILFNNCTDGFVDLNTPPDALVADNLTVSQVGQAFARSQYWSINVANYEIGQNLFADMFSQYMALTQSNFHSDRYVDVGSWSNGLFNGFYNNVAKEIVFVEKFTAENNLAVENAVAKVWKVQAFHRFTDYYGPVPYFGVGSGETSIPYDSQESIYRDFFTQLDEAVAVLEQNTGSSVFPNDDLIYNGDVNSWLIFANSLRLRLALRVKYADPTLAQQEAEKAVAAGVMISNDESAFVLTTENNIHRLGPISNFDNWRMSALFESLGVGYEDPRMEHYWNPVVENNRNDGRLFLGLRNGLPVGDMSSSLLNPTHSKIDTKWWRMDMGGENPDFQVMKASEVYFLRAEGALEGWDMGGTAQELYEAGIETSLIGETDATPVEIADYIQSDNVPVPLNDVYNTPASTDIPVAFEAGGDPERQLEQILTQKWLALFPDGWEAWTEMRRTGYPRLVPRLVSDNPDVANDEMIRRLTYTQGEFANNATAVNAAIESPEIANRGGDTNATRLWWDAKD